MVGARRESGVALLLALVVLVLITAAVVLFATSMSVDQREAQQEALRIRLGTLEDSAMAEALAALAESETFRGNPGRRFGRGVISSVVSRDPSTPADRRQVVATATLAGRSRSLVAEVQLTIRGTQTVPVVLSWSEQADAR